MISGGRGERGGVSAVRTFLASPLLGSLIFFHKSKTLNVLCTFAQALEYAWQLLFDVLSCHVPLCDVCHRPSFISRLELLFFYIDTLVCLINFVSFAFFVFSFD